MHMTRYGTLLAAAVLAACEGGGSDVGLRLEPLPQAFGKVQVFDDQGRGVVGAAVSAPELGVRGTTGRNGRATLYNALRGPVRLRVDATSGAAVDGDALGAVELLAPAATDLGVAVYVPEFPPASRVAVTAGTQSSPVAVVGTSGAQLTVAAAGSIGLPAAAATGELALGELSAAHLPGPMPAAVGGVRLMSRGYCIEPTEATFVDAGLEAPDDLGATGVGGVVLLRFDASTGTWLEVAGAVTAAGGRLTATGMVDRGGIYAFAATVPAATVRGRVLDQSDRGLSDQLVNVDGRWTITDGGGRFVVVDAPGAEADGSPRQATVEVVAGGRHVPRRLATSIAVVPAGDADLGDLEVATATAVNVRLQHVRRGRPEPERRSGISSSRYPVALTGTTDRDGRIAFDDVPFLWMGFQTAHPLDIYEANYSQAIVYADGRTRQQDAYAYYDDIGWFLGGRRSRTLVSDSVGGGPIEGAVVVAGSVAGQGYQGIVRDAGTLFLDRTFSGRATASYRSENDGRTVVSAVSIVTPNGEHLELPLERALWRPLGAFDRHGLVAGRLLGADPSREHELRARGPMEIEEWWDDVVGGQPLRTVAPVDVDVATTHDEFVVGVPSPRGNLAATEASLVGGVRTLQRVGLALDVEPIEAQTTARDVAMDLPADATFTVEDALLDLDSALASGDLRIDLALVRSSGRVVDVARDLGGNHTAVGDDLTLALPGLSGSLADASWLAVVGGSATNGGETIRQQAVCRLTNDTTARVPMLPVPTIAAPAGGATVSAAGFRVDFTLPAESFFARLDLVADDGVERKSWRICLPPDATSFEFVTLPQEAVSPLVAGKTYTLTLTAYRAETSLLLQTQYPYWSYSTFLQSLSPAEIGVTAVSSRAIQVTAQ
ncbi:MAG: hypothetical protein RL398_1145 [Planctomycetota bacterium]